MFSDIIHINTLNTVLVMDMDVCKCFLESGLLLKQATNWKTVSAAPSTERNNVLKAIYFRDYLAIGVCAGFLVVLYIFAMIVFIMIKLKQVISQISDGHFQ